VGLLRSLGLGTYPLHNSAMIDKLSLLAGLVFCPAERYFSPADGRNRGETGEKGEKSLSAGEKRQK